MSQSSEVQQQVKNQSLQNINNPFSAEEETDTREEPDSSPLQPSVEKKIQGQKPLIRWPKSCERAVWEEINGNLSNILGSLHDTTLKKLERMGKIIYTYGAEHF